MDLAIIGSGIAGLGAAWLLRRQHRVTLFETNQRLGGHTWTVNLQQDGVHTHPLDIGFMVFNQRTYPNLTRLFTQLSLPLHKAEMSLSITCQSCHLEYNGGSLRGLAAQPENLRKPHFWRLLSGIVGFNRRATHALASGTVTNEESLAHLLERWRLGAGVARHYLYPMAAAIWSSGTGAIADFPARSLLQFMANHGLLGVTTHHQWYSVRGGAATYVRALAAPLGEGVRPGMEVKVVERTGGGVRLHFAGGGSENFHGVVIATHADQALKLLLDPTQDERELLGQWAYSSNRVILHTDTSLLPSRPAAHAAWNVLQRECDRPGDEVCVTYLLNRLQEVNSRQQYLVTLNPITPPAREKVLLETTMRHPIMNAASLATQPYLPRLNGVRRTWYCGAYHGWGFHEDGLAAAIRVADDLGVSFL